MSVLVVGGGISGLAAAHELALGNIPVLVAEAGDRFGGKIATERTGGFLVEHGPDSMLTTRPAGMDLARAVGLGGELAGVQEPRLVHILRDGRPVPMPDGLGLILPTKLLPFARTRLFSWPEKARMALDVALPRLMAPGDEAVGTYLRRRLGPALVDRLAAPLVGGVYGTAIDELSIDAVMPSLRDAERRHRSLLLAGLADGRRFRAAAAARAATTTPASGIRGTLGMFATLRGGLGALVDAVVHDLEVRGCVSLALGTRVLSLEPTAGGVNARLSDGRCLRFDAAVIATPGPAAARLLDAFAPAAASAVGSVPHTSSTVVTLAYPTDAFPVPPVGHGWLVPPSAGLPVSAFTWSSNKWAGRAPEGSILVRAFLPGEPTGGRTDTELVALARTTLRRLAGVTRVPSFARTASFVGSMPRYTVGHLERVAQAEHALAAFPGIRLSGAPYRGVGIPDCIAAARTAVTGIRAYLGTPEPGPAVDPATLPA